MEKAKTKALAPREFTLLAVIIGIVVAIVMTAANVYLGLYAGMTVSASIPAAVIGMGIFKGIFRQQSIHQSNIVQTMASAGESLAAGIIFTLPALVIVGAWKDFDFVQTSLIAISGGLLGIIFMIPLRRALIVDEKELTYPEGVACAAVLEAGCEESGGSHSGFITILKGLGLGAVFKLLSSGFNLLQGSVEKAFFGGNKVWFFGSDISPALLSVGYIVKLEVALLVFAGGVIGWFIGIPVLGLTPEQMAMSPLDAGWTLWSTQVRYLGVGAMVTGGLWSIVTVKSGIKKGVSELVNTYNNRGQSQLTARTDTDMSLVGMMTIFFVALAVMFWLYQTMIGSVGYTILTTAIMVIASFIFVAVSSYIVGLVGSSNNPVSGMTISALLGIAALFLVLGFTGDSAVLATLGVASIVCCAACTAGDCSQDLKTGVLIGSTPKYQQYAQIIGVIIPAFVIAPVLTLLHGAYGIGTGLKAPQATLFASITNALFGKGNLPYTMVGIGVILGAVIIFCDEILKKKKSKYRLHVMPVAVGIYLPITLAVPMMIGAIIRYFIDKARGGEEKLESSDNGVLLSSGLIAGEAIMGVVLAIFLYFEYKMGMSIFSNITREILSIVALGLIAWVLYREAKKKI